MQFDIKTWFYVSTELWCIRMWLSYHELLVQVVQVVKGFSKVMLQYCESVIEVAIVVHVL